jgi:hypothetical protein
MAKNCQFGTTEKDPSSLPNVQKRLDPLGKEILILRDGWDNLEEMGKIYISGNQITIELDVDKTETPVVVIRRTVRAV